MFNRNAIIIRILSQIYETKTYYRMKYCGYSDRGRVSQDLGEFKEQYIFTKNYTILNHIFLISEITDSLNFPSTLNKLTRHTEYS